MLNKQISANDTIVSDAYGSAFSILFNEYLNKDNPKIDILFFPNLEILPYDRFSTAVDIISRRQEILHKMTHQPKNTLIITSISNTLRKLAPASFIQEHSFILKTSDNLDISKYKMLLTEAGYTLVNNVFEKGEFSIRGSIINIYSIGSKIAFRLDFFDDELTSFYDYLPQSTNIHLVDNIANSIKSFSEEEKFRYNELKHDSDKPILPYQEIFYSQQEIQDIYRQYKNIKWFQQPKSKSKTLKVNHLEKISVNYKLANPFRDLQQLVDKTNFDKVIFSTDSNGRAELLLEHLNKLNLNIKSCKSFNEALKVAAKFCLIISPFQERVINCFNYRSRFIS